MYERRVALFCGLLLATFMIGCVTGGGTLDSYKPKSTAESEITKCLIDLQEAFNREDVDGYLNRVLSIVPHKRRRRCLAATHDHDNKK
jgi:hypothetical protein